MVKAEIGIETQTVQEEGDFVINQGVAQGEEGRTFVNYSN
jgi:hypothetical protein